MSRWLRAYPLVIGFYSVVHLAAANPWEWSRFTELLAPLATVACVVLLVWIGAALLTRDPDKRALVTAVVMMAFVGHGTVLRWVKQWPWANKLGVAWTALLVTLVLTAYIVLFVATRHRPLSRLSRFLGVFAGWLLVFGVLQLLLVQRGRAETPVISEVPVVAAGHRGRPSIFLLILDKYTGSASLRSRYGYDNAGFEQALRDRGFVLPRDARANYSYTRQAVISLLNWTYLDSLADAVGRRGKSLAPLYAMWRQNRTMTLLKQLGYAIVVLPNSYPPFRNSPQADRQLPPPESLTPYFPISWRQTTLLDPLVAITCAVIECRSPVLEPAELVNWKFDRLGALAASSRPQFVLAHLPVPHEPFIYSADCRPTPAYRVWAPAQGWRNAYLDQITCVNQKVLQAVDAIIASAPVPPVILIQADHGRADIPVEQFPLGMADPEQVRMRLDVFAAYRVPGAPDSVFYDGISPVNVLPIVLNQLFGTRFPRQPDRSYWVREATPYDIWPVDDVFAAAKAADPPSRH